MEQAKRRKTTITTNETKIRKRFEMIKEEDNKIALKVELEKAALEF